MALKYQPHFVLRILFWLVVKVTLIFAFSFSPIGSNYARYQGISPRCEYLYCAIWFMHLCHRRMGAHSSPDISLLDLA